MVLNTNDLNGLSAEQIVDFLVGVGVTVENIQITGANEAIGFFSGGISEGIGIEEGVILSSGNISDASGPNDGDGTGTGLGTPGDEDLDTILQEQNQTTNDAVILEFDFTPENEQFLFEYVFASDEYNEFANSAFNDIFAFFLNDENIALIPGTAVPVSINNINLSENSSFFRNNDPSELPEPLPFNTEFDGFTTKLAARGFVTPGQKQNLKLVIADTGDSILDSAVFLKAGSLSTLGPSPDATLNPNERDIFSVDGSPGFAKLKFSLSGTNTDSINEVGVFVVDDEQGRIDGVAPGEADYEKLALTGVRSRAIFAGLNQPLAGGIDQTRFLNFDTGEKLGFYLVTNGTTDMMLSDLPLYIYPQKPQVFFSFPEENPDGIDHLNVTNNGDILTLAWEDGVVDSDFNDLILTAEVVEQSASPNLSLSARRQGEIQKEIIDLTVLEPGETITANVVITSESYFNNFVGLYRLDDFQGRVIDPLTGDKLSPEDQGYAAAAIRQRVVEFDRSGGGAVELSNGFYAPYIVVNTTPEQWLQENPENQVFRDTFAYFPFMKANGGSFDFEHVALLGDNTFGFEDHRIAESDFDFNDMIMSVEF